MKQTRVLGICGLSLLLALSSASWAADSMTMGTGSGRPGTEISIPLTLSAPTSEVQGLVAVVEWDSALLPAGKLVPVGLDWTPVVSTADSPHRRFGFDDATEKGFFSLGVVITTDDAPPFFIPPAESTLLATLRLKWELAPADVIPDSFAGVTVPLAFVDGKYGLADTGDVVLDNIIVIGGFSVGVPDLALNAGSVTLLPPAIGTLTIVGGAGKFGETVAAKIQLDASKPVQGFVLSITHADPDLTLQSIAPGAATGAAEFKKDEIFPNGGTYGLIMDFDSPIGNTPAIPAGVSEVAVFNYTSKIQIATVADCDRADQVSQLTFEDFALGDPLKENVIVIAGLSKNPELVDGSVRFSVDKTKPPCYEPTGIMFAYAAGGCDLVDDPESPDKDVHKPSDIEVTRGTVESPGKFGVGLWYRNPPNPYASDEGSNQLEQIQGLSMALRFDPACIWCDGTYSLAGTITETVGAEFVNVMCENRTDDLGSDDTDGVDEGELIVGILVDALPPFDGRDLPPSSDYLKVVCVDFHVTDPNGACTDCQDVVLSFPAYPDGGDVIGPNGVESPVIRNVASIRKRYLDEETGEWVTLQESVTPKQLVPGHVTVLNEPVFVRGDCNWSQYVRDDAHTQYAVDISDAAAVISFLFYTGTWQFLPPCMDACDANDDGRIDLADSVYILRYLFKFDKLPPAPFPEPGTDPSPDRLTCEAGSECI